MSFLPFLLLLAFLQPSELLSTQPIPPRAPLRSTLTNPPITVNPATHSAVLKWKDNKRAALYLSFDDACTTHLTNAIPELAKRQIPGTFYVITGEPRFKNPAWDVAAKSPCVILANHTLTHKDFPTLEKFETELIQAAADIRRIQPNNPSKLLSFGKPGGVKYGITDPEIETLLLKHNHLNRLPFAGYPFQFKTVASLDTYIDNAIETTTLAHMDFHGIGGDWLVTPMDVFTAFLDKLQANRDTLWLTDAASAQKYEAERNAAKLELVESAPTQLRLRLTSATDSNLYDQPLTLATHVPAAWTSLTIHQGSTPIKPTSVLNNTVLYDALPNGPEITLSPAR